VASQGNYAPIRILRGQSLAARFRVVHAAIGRVSAAIRCTRARRSSRICRCRAAERYQTEILRACWLRLSRLSRFFADCRTPASRAHVRTLAVLIADTTSFRARI